MADSFNKMIEQFKTLADLQEYAEAQSQTIISQSRKIQELETELSLMRSGKASILTLPNTLNVDDEETIARVQLVRLKDASAGRDLTLEEARKLEIYSKIINQIENRPRKNAIPTKNLSTDDLIKQLESSDE